MKKKWLIGFIGIAVIGVSLFMMFAKNNNADAMVVKDISYTLESQTLSQSLYADGVVEVKHEENVFSEVNATVKEVFVEVGDTVKAGDLVMTLDTSKLMQSLEQSKYQLLVDQDALNDLKVGGSTAIDASYERASSAYETAKLNYSNNQSLYEQGAISASELNQTQSSMETAYLDFVNAMDKKASTSLKSEIEKLTTKIRMTQLTIESIVAQSDTFDIKATKDGTVTTLNDTIGKSVNVGESLATVSELSQLTITAMISEYDIPQIKVGQNVNISTLGNPDHIYNGSVIEIAPTGVVSASEVLVEVTISIQNPDELLKPNFTTNLEIVVAKVDNALAVPFDALSEDENGKISIMKESPTGKEKIYVEKGMETDFLVQIISDQLKEGDVLIWLDKLAQSSENKDTSPSLLPPAGGRPSGM